jgi:hypothetical protein
MLLEGRNSGRGNGGRVVHVCLKILSTFLNYGFQGFGLAGGFDDAGAAGKGFGSSPMSK